MCLNHRIVLKRYYPKRNKQESLFIAKVFYNQFTADRLNEFLFCLEQKNTDLLEFPEWDDYKRIFKKEIEKHEKREKLGLTVRKYIYNIKNTHISKHYHGNNKDKVSIYAELCPKSKKEIYLSDGIIRSANRIYCTESYIRLHHIDDVYLDDVIKEIKVGNNREFNMFCSHEGYTCQQFITCFCKKRYKGFYTKFALLR